MSGLRIALDDERNFSLDQIDILFRSPQHMVPFLIQTTQDVDMLYLDNDLGDGVLEGRYVLRHLLKEGIKPKKVCIVTANPIAKISIEKELTDYGYSMFNERVWEIHS